MAYDFPPRRRPSRDERTSIKLPPTTLLHGPQARGNMYVSKPGKPPRLRFQPGAFVRYKGELHEVLYAYRVEGNPHEWIYCLAERKSLTPPNRDLITKVVLALGAGQSTPRIVYEIFPDSYKAHQFFIDIPSEGDTVDVTNKNMMKDAVLVSSGEVVP